MPVTRGDYERLTRPKRAAFGVVDASSYNLWLGPEHILRLERRRYTEDYKRFPYESITGLVITLNKQRFITNIVLGCIALMLFVPMVAGIWLGWGPGSHITLGVLDGILLLAILINTLRGPTCSTYIHTSIQSVKLTSVNRLSIAMRVLERVREKVSIAQGGLNLLETAPTPQTERIDARRTASRRSTKPLVPYKGNAILFLLMALLMDTIHSVVHFFSHGKAFSFAGILIFIALLMAMIIALLRQHGTDLYKDLKLIPWLTIAYLGLMTVYQQFCLVVLAASAPESFARTGADSLSNVSPLESAPVMVGTIISLVVSAALGFYGLIRFNAFAKNRAITAAPSPPAAGPNL